MLGKLLAEKKPLTRMAAADALGSVGKRAGSMAPALEKLLKDKEHAVRCQAAFALWRVTGKEEKALPVLQEVLASGSIADRRRAATCLGKMGSAAAKAVPALAEALTSTDRNLKADVHRTLRRMPTDAVVSGLIKPLQKVGKDPYRFIEAVKLLGAMGPRAKKAVPTLKTLWERYLREFKKTGRLRPKDAKVRDAVEMAIRQITGRLP